MDPQTTPPATPEAPSPAATTQTQAASAQPEQPATTATPWEQYVGHIVRWEDGTSWFVLRDGRHWIPDGDAYSKLTATQAQVFNLQAAQLDAIPDIKGASISIAKG